MSKIKGVVVAVVGDDEREGRGDDGEVPAGVEWSGPHGQGGRPMALDYSHEGISGGLWPFLAHRGRTQACLRPASVRP